MKNQTINTTKEDSVSNIIDTLNKYSLEESIEILGNVFIELGIHGIETEKKMSITSSNIGSIIVNDVKENGDTIGNTLARQGLIILSWLNEGKE